MQIANITLTNDFNQHNDSVHEIFVGVHVYLEICANLTKEEDSAGIMRFQVCMQINVKNERFASDFN